LSVIGFLQKIETRWYAIQARRENQGFEYGSVDEGGWGEASKCLSRDLGITLEEMVEMAEVRGQYLVVKFPWACGRAPRSSHDGFRPYDEETEKSGFLVF